MNDNQIAALAAIIAAIIGLCGGGVLIAFLRDRG